MTLRLIAGADPTSSHTRILNSLERLSAMTDILSWRSEQREAAVEYWSEGEHWWARNFGTRA